MKAAATTRRTTMTISTATIYAVGPSVGQNMEAVASLVLFSGTSAGTHTHTQ